MVNKCPKCKKEAVLIEVNSSHIKNWFVCSACLDELGATTKEKMISAMSGDFGYIISKLNFHKKNNTANKGQYFSKQFQVCFRKYREKFNELQN